MMSSIGLISKHLEHALIYRSSDTTVLLRFSFISSQGKGRLLIEMETDILNCDWIQFRDDTCYFNDTCGWSPHHWLVVMVTWLGIWQFDWIPWLLSGFTSHTNALVFLNSQRSTSLSISFDLRYFFLVPICINIYLFFRWALCTKHILTETVIGIGTSLCNLMQKYAANPDYRTWPRPR